MKTINEKLEFAEYLVEIHNQLEEAISAYDNNCSKTNLDYVYAVINLMRKEVGEFLKEF